MMLCRSVEGALGWWRVVVEGGGGGWLFEAAGCEVV
jgi:hypothetical protein